MTKKQVSILFLFLANVLLLVHSIVPHHHHNEELCLENKHCVSCDHDHLSVNHEHSASDLDFCLIKSMYAVQGDLTNLQNVKTVQQIDRSLFLSADASVIVDSSVKTRSGIIACQPNLYAYLGIKSFGLRAPPMV